MVANAFLILAAALHAPAFALQGSEILIIANANLPDSIRVARHYCNRRGIGRRNILALDLSPKLEDDISRDDYEKKLAEPIRRELTRNRFPMEIGCLLTVYGVPLRVGPRGPLRTEMHKLPELRLQAGRLEKQIKNLQSKADRPSQQRKSQLRAKLRTLRAQVDRITGKETGASVDSELSMVLCEDYELYRWQPNPFYSKASLMSADVLMVARLDGPSPEIAISLVDKALAAESKSLSGTAYIDCRGLPTDTRAYTPGYYDRSLRDLATLIRASGRLPVKVERTEQLFQPGRCPQTAIYCGWYSLQQYVDAFDFVDGAIGYHISSLEAVDLHDPTSTQWCAAMLRDGVTATIGAVAEPYLHAFPEPSAFFRELFDGRCLVEAYYRTKPFNSWQLVLIGDPLYRPFRSRSHRTTGQRVEKNHRCDTDDTTGRGAAGTPRTQAPPYNN